MEEAMRLISRTAQSGRSFAKRGLLYEAAYRYGQAAAMMGMLYVLHGQDLLKLAPAVQEGLARLHEKVAILAASLGHSAGNGRHKMGSADSDARESLIRTIGMLQEDLQSLGWS